MREFGFVPFTGPANIVRLQLGGPKDYWGSRILLSRELSFGSFSHIHNSIIIGGGATAAWADRPCDAW